jgi:GH25 family lysozyme M1 (1,4-beta-N-acetylmuramidase)
MSKEQPIWGIDVSHWQQGLDMNQVKAEGYEFAVIKASEGPYQDGSRYTDPSYRTHLNNAEAAGLIVGAYHFLVETPPKAQVDHFLDVAGDVSGKIVMVDFEEYPPPYQYLTPHNATLKGFVAELRRRIGDHPIVIYTGRGFWDGGEPTGPASQFGDVTTWDAYYLTMSPVDPKPFYEDMKEHGWGEPWGNQEPMFWQFTSAGRVAGLNLDVNAFRGTREQLLALTGAEERDYWVSFTANREQWMRGVNVPHNAWAKPTQSGGKVWLELVPPGTTPAGTEYQTYGWMGFTADGEQWMRGVDVPDNAWIKPTETCGKVWLEFVPPA